jgi:hypothetical protein
LLEDIDLSVCDAKGLYAVGVDDLHQVKGRFSVGDLGNDIDLVTRVPGLYHIPRIPGDFFSRIIMQRIPVGAMFIEKGLIPAPVQQEGHLVPIHGGEPVFLTGPAGEKTLKMPVGMRIDLIQRYIGGDLRTTFVIRIGGGMIIILGGGRCEEPDEASGK